MGGSIVVYCSGTNILEKREPEAVSCNEVGAEFLLVRGIYARFNGIILWDLDCREDRFAARSAGFPGIYHMVSHRASDMKGVVCIQVP